MSTIFFPQFPCYNLKSKLSEPNPAKFSMAAAAGRRGAAVSYTFMSDKLMYICLSAATAQGFSYYLYCNCQS